MIFGYKCLAPCLLEFLMAKATTLPIDNIRHFTTLLTRLLLGIDLPTIQLRKFVLHLDYMDLRNDARPVKSFRVVVHTLGAWPNRIMSDNHWSIYLLLKDNDRSVHMDMIAESDSPKGILEWSPDLAYTLPHSAIQHWDYSFKSGVTVAKVYNLIMEKHRDQYSISGGGSGCRWWV